MLIGYLSAELRHLVFCINIVEIEVVSSSRFRLPIDTIKRFCIKVDVLVEVVTLTPKTANITTRAVDVYAGTVK